MSFSSSINSKSCLASNALLRASLNAGRFKEAVQLFYSMFQGFGDGGGRTLPDNFTYPLVLKACSMIPSLDDGKRVHQFIQYANAHHNAKPNVYVYCALIHMFSKCGSLDDARTVFEGMPFRDLASWTAMICATLQNHNSSSLLEAVALFRRMRLEGLRPDSVTVAAILPASARLQDGPTGTALHGFSVTCGFDTDLYVSNALIDMYCKCENTTDACSIFTNMVSRDAVSWGSLISGFSQNFRYSQSLKLYVEMRNSGIQTNAMTAASVLHVLGNLRMSKQGKSMHGYILKEGLKSDVALKSALIHMYANCGSMEEAENILKTITSKDITIWNSLMVGYSLNCDIPSAFGVFRRIWESKLHPNPITLVSLLPLCTQMGALRQGKEIHGYAIRSSLGMVVSVGNSLIDMYGKCGYLELGRKVFHQMMEKNIVTYNTIISAHGVHGLGEQAILFLKKMEEEGIKPNKITFVALLAACSHAGLTKRGLSLYKSMVDDYGILPNMEHYSCIVDLLGRAGHLDDACEFIRKMPVEPDINVWGSLLAAARIHNMEQLAAAGIHNMEQLADTFVKYIGQKDIGDPGYFVLLSNIYASTDRKEAASKFRRLMKEKGLIKKPGSSWIQVGEIIHEFHARGGMHPDFSNIQGILESLLLNIMDNWYMLGQSFSTNRFLGDTEELRLLAL